MTFPAPYPADTRARGWRFEVDMEKVEASDTWLKAKTGAVRGALLLLWAKAWQQNPCGTLPNDDELIALLIDMPDASFAKHKAVLLRGWKLADDGRLYHDTITARVLAMLDKRAGDAQRAANRRARNAESSGNHAEVTRDSQANNGQVGAEFDTKHQAPSTRELPPTPLDEIVELYHAKLPDLPAVRLKTAKRDRACRDFWRWVLTSKKSDGEPRAKTADEAVGWIGSYFERVNANDFLMGRRPGKEHPNWRADFDFLLTERGRTHVIERTVEA
jgi:uncharacterized protein YdaU (DUF1376 family)